MICKNCGNLFEGKFCNLCGQKAGVRRFTIRLAAREFLHTFTHVDSGILFLIKEMFLRPGITASEYIEGKRKKYFSPVQYLILSIAVSTFLTLKLGVIGLNEVSPEIFETLNDTQKFFLQFNNFIYRFFNLTLFAGIPVMAMYSKLLYRKSGYNYSENVIFNTFLAAQRTLIYILMMPLLYAYRDKWFIGIGAYYFIFVVYMGWGYVQFFNGGKIWCIVKYFFVFLLTWVTLQFLSMLIFYLFFFSI